jgi:ascorbate-specific PTS system EIIC-type component UlaA
MNKKQAAVGKYFSDILKSVGLALVLFSGLGMALQRKEAILNLTLTISMGVIGGLFIIAGAIIVLHSTDNDEDGK